MMSSSHRPQRRSRRRPLAAHRHNAPAAVRGTFPIERLLELTGVEDQLVLVDDPDDLAPPTWTA